MLRHFIADRTKQAAAARLADIGISTRRKLKGRCRLQTANLTARNAVAALVAAEKAGSDGAKRSVSVMQPTDYSRLVFERVELVVAPAVCRQLPGRRLRGCQLDG